jgi:N-acyl-D-amino-acid deacylase
MHYSGLTYTPGMYASTSELASLCEALAKEFPGAFYAPHHRSYGFQAIESYAEMLGLGESTGCPIRMFCSISSHSKCARHKKQVYV